MSALVGASASFAPGTDFRPIWLTVYYLGRGNVVTAPAGTKRLLAGSGMGPGPDDQARRGYDPGGIGPAPGAGPRAVRQRPEHRERRQVRVREYRRERYADDPEFRQRVLERNREYQRERYANDPEFRERKRALERKRRLERERYAHDPEYRERRREQKREYKRTRYANDPGFRERQLLVIGERNRERLATDAEYRERNREYRRRKKGRAVARQLTARRRADLMEGSA